MFDKPYGGSAGFILGSLNKSPFEWHKNMQNFNTIFPNQWKLWFNNWTNMYSCCKPIFTDDAYLIGFAFATIFVKNEWCFLNSSK